MSRLFSWIVLIVACLGVVAALGWVKYGQIQAAIAYGASFPEPSESVEFALVAEREFQPRTQVTGQVVAVRSVELLSEVAGVVATVGFESAATVSEGQLLLALDTREERAERDAAKAELDMARLDRDRARKLEGTGAAPPDTLDRAQAAYRSAAARLAAVVARIARREIRAPFAGKTSLHQFEAGQYLSAGDPITRLVGTGNRVWIDFAVPQQQAGLVRDSVRVRLPGADAFASGALVASDAAVSEQSRNLRFRAELSRAELDAVPGALVQVEVPLGAPRRAALVPVTAVRRDHFGARVFVLEPAEEGAAGAERAVLRSVEIGETLGNELVVIDGLKPGERVAATGAFKLRDGVLVNSVPYLSAMGEQG